MQVSDGDHVDRLISCLYMALPFFVVRIFFDGCDGNIYNFLLVQADDISSFKLKPYIVCRGVLQVASFSII